MDSIKTFFVFMGFMIAGFLLLVYNRANPHGGSNYSIMLGSNQTHAYIRENCIKAVQPKLAEKLYSPSKTSGEGSTQIEMLWQTSPPNAHTVSCRYEQGKGISEIKIDGASIGPISIDTGLDPASRLSNKHDAH